MSGTELATAEAPELDIEGISKISDEDAYYLLVLNSAQMVAHGHEEMGPDKTFGEHVDRDLHNFAAHLYKIADAAKTDVDMAAKLFEHMVQESDEPMEKRAAALLKLKAWRHRQSEGQL